MDKIHDIENKPWISKRTLNIKRLIRERGEELRQNCLELDCDANNEGVTSDRGDNDNQVEDGDLKTELDKFINSKQEEVRPYFLFNSTSERTLVTDPECMLKTYRVQLEHAKRMITDRNYKVCYLSNLQTTRRELLMRHLASMNRDSALVDRGNSAPETSRPPSSAEPIPTIGRELVSVGGEVQVSEIKDELCAVVVVQVWPQPTRGGRVRLEREILFRADQKLTELRDLMKCQRDYGVPMDLSEMPEQTERIFRGELFKSGFFLIGNTFFNDMRDSNNIDLSADIIEWSQKKVSSVDENGRVVSTDRGIGRLESRRMEEHTFEDLEFRLGCPYLYLHQGDCEHLFTISDVRYLTHSQLMGSSTLASGKRFPFVTASSYCQKADQIRCYMCKSRPPHWYTRNNSRLPVDPYFFCENCFHSFNYDKDKKKVGQFQAYLYTSALGIPDSVTMGP